MTFDTELLVREADRLVVRADRQLGRYRKKLQDCASTSDNASVLQRVGQLKLELQRLELYRAVVKSSPYSHAALLPEFLEASGLLPRKRQQWRRSRL